MRGSKQIDPKMFYQVQLDDLVPHDDVLRQLSSILDFEFVRRRTVDLYYHAGPHSVDPVVVVKVLLLSFLHGLSIRETMRQASDRLSWHWFLQYDLDETVPDHSVVSKALVRFGPELFEEFFHQILGQCDHAGLLGKRLLHVDSSVIKANASESSVAVKPLLLAEAFHPDLAPRAYWDGDYFDQAMQQLEQHPPGSDLRRRQTVVEGSFGRAKEDHGHRQSRWRGQMKMQIQCYLVATAQNLKKLLKYAWHGKRAQYAVGNPTVTMFHAYLLQPIMGHVSRLQPIMGHVSRLQPI